MSIEPLGKLTKHRAVVKGFLHFFSNRNIGSSLNLATEQLLNILLIFSAIQLKDGLSV